MSPNAMMMPRSFAKGAAMPRRFRRVLQNRCVLRVAVLRPSELETADQHLPLNRLEQYVEEGSTYLIAWDDDRPVGHAHIAWQRTHVGVQRFKTFSWCPSGVARGLRPR